MIVNLAAWLYIIEALLGVAMLTVGPWGMGSVKDTLAALIISAIFGAMGYGLLKREVWGRWLALGSSLLSFTFGTLFLTAIVAVALYFHEYAVGVAMMLIANGALGMIVVLILMVQVASVIISFKLFFHLCSRQGCEDFGAPYGSAGAVLASAVSWIAVFGVQTMMAGAGDVMSLLAGHAMARDEPVRRERYDARREAEVRAYEQPRENEPMPSPSEPQISADFAEPVPATDEPPVAADEARAPSFADAPPDQAADDESDKDRSKILKCRDASGGITFTQGYCPPGTQRVAMPTPE